MRVVWKFEMNVGSDDVFLQMPAISQIVEARFHPATKMVTLWALCKSDTPLVTKTFMIVGTGQTYDRVDEQVVQYIWTVFDDDYVWHIFEVLGVKCPGPQ